MHIITELYEVDSCRSILLEKFIDNKRKWEQVAIASETAFIKDGYYHMQNHSKNRWNYYHTNTPLKSGENFVLETSIQLETKEDVFGHFGLIWGFDKERNYLNRFTISADGKRALIMHFEKDHKRIIHRYQNRKLPAIKTFNSVHLGIIKLGAYFHFSINRVNIYSAHESLFADEGSLIGYYIEPGLLIKSNYLEVKRIKARPLEVVTGLQQLMSKN